MSRKFRIGLAVSTVLALGAVGGLALARQDRQEPGVSLAHDLVAAASAFENYTRGATAISPGFDSGESVSTALATSAAYKAEQLETGMIAYAAIAALQEPEFLDGVRQALSETPREVLIARLTDHPDSVIEIDGVGAAATRAQAALALRARPLGVAGRAVKQSAYSIQHHAWSKALVSDNPGRLARIKAMSNALFTPGEEDAGRLIQAATAPREGDRFGAEGGAAFTPVTVRAAALAALAVLGAADDDHVAQLSPVLQEESSAYCMKMAKLNLYQCLAVAGPHYEDVFCLGQHALIDTAQCVSKAAGDVGGDASLKHAAMSPAPRKPTGFMIPTGPARSTEAPPQP